MAYHVTLSTGEQLSIGPRISTNGHTNVFRASILDRASKMTRMFAAKRQEKGKASKREEALLLHEGRLLKSLDHPHIIDGTLVRLRFSAEPIVLMEYFEYGDLHQFLTRNGALNGPEAIRLIQELLDALQYLYETGLVISHRDIKPSNLLVTRSGSLRLTDFGVARTPDPHPDEENLKFAGTPVYSAPEQIHDARQADIRSDIYSTGIVLYELLSGTSWMGDCPPKAVIQRRKELGLPHLKKAFDLKKQQVEAINAIIACACDDNPDKRFQTPKEFSEALEQVKGYKRKGFFG